MHCIRCGKSGLFLRVNEEMHCKACAEELRQERERLALEQEKQAKERKQAKRTESRLYYEALCAAYSVVADDLIHPSARGLKKDELTAKYQACDFLIKQLPLWRNYEFFEVFYMRDCQPYPKIPGCFENSRLPAGIINPRIKTNFQQRFDTIIEDVQRASTIFLLGDRTDTVIGSGSPSGTLYYVAGTKYREKNIIALATLNPDFDMSKRELIDEFMIDEKIWKYLFYQGTAELVPEPENPYDPNAIKVVIDEKHVGYIESSRCSHLLAAMREGRVGRISCKIGGGPYKYLSEDYDLERDKETYTLERGERPYSVALYIDEK